MTLIRSIEALKQPLDFSPFARYCSDMSDIDGIFRLKNGNRILLEVKKDTFNHTPDKIINGNQWQLLREIADNRKNYYIIYATHNQQINANELINLRDCKVRYVENCNRSLDCSIYEDLLDCVHWISFLHSEHKYYIVVKYPDGEMKYAICKPIEKMWILDKYINISCDFDNYETAFNYIKTRYKKPMNKNNQYLLFRKDGKIDTLEKTFSFADFEYMF